MNYLNEKSRQHLLEAVYIIGLRFFLLGKDYNISGRRNHWEVPLSRRLRINAASTAILGNNIRLR